MKVLLLFFNFLFVFSLFAQIPSVSKQNSRTNGVRVFVVSEYDFDNKNGIKKLVDAYNKVESLDCFATTPGCREASEKLRKLLVEPVWIEIQDSLKQVEKQNNVIILEMGKLAEKRQVLAFNQKFDITRQFITFFNNKGENPNETLKLEIPESKIAVIDTKRFEDEENGLKRHSNLSKQLFAEVNKEMEKEFGTAKPDLNPETIRNFIQRFPNRISHREFGQELVRIGKAIQTFADQKKFSIVFDSSKQLPPELKGFPVQNITKEFISYYNQNNP
jgi:hypothetical protein